MGNEHVPTGSPITYGFCPPTSGDHYNAVNRGPIRPGVYPPGAEEPPGGWVHNLEHGYVVVLYRNTPEDAIADADFEQLQAFYEQVPQLGSGVCARKVVVAEFDQMTTNYALVAWGRALLLDEWDLDRANTFVQQWTDHEAVPERGIC